MDAVATPFEVDVDMETGAGWLKRLRSLFEAESELCYATLSILASSPADTFVLSSGNALFAASSVQVVKTSRATLQRCIDQGYWISSINGAEYVHLLQRLAAGIAPEFEGLAQPFLDAIGPFPACPEGLEEVPLDLGIRSPARPIAHLNPASTGSSEVSTPRNVSFSSLDSDDLSDDSSELCVESAHKVHELLSDCDGAKSRKRSPRLDAVVASFTWLVFSRPEYEAAYCLLQNQRSCVADSVVLLVALFGSVMQQAWEPLPGSATFTARFSSAALILWLGIIILCNKRYLQWREAVTVVGNMVMGIALCRLKWCSLLETDQETRCAAIRHLMSQPLVEAGLFYAIQIRLCTAVFWRSIPSAFFTTWLNFYIIRDGMPGDSLLLWMAISAVVRTAAIAIAARAYRQVEAKARTQFLTQYCRELAP